MRKELKVNFMSAIRKFLARCGSPLQARVRQDLADVAALHRLRYCTELENYIPWTQYALRPSAVEAILNEIVIHQRRHVLELGGGISSIYQASLLNRVGGKLVVIDHDQAWIDLLSGMLNRQGNLGSTVTLVHAPLKSQIIADRKYIYYAREAVDLALDNSKFDVLLVDGPPSVSGQMSRYPALPVLHGFLEDDYVIFLDDTFRADEAATAKRWSQLFRLRMYEPERIGGFAILRPQNTRKNFQIV